MKKKYIVIVAAVLIALIIGATLIKPKNTNLMYEFNGEKVDAEDYYEMLVEKYGIKMVFQFLEREYLSTLEVSDDIKSMAKLQAQSLVNEETKEEEKDSINESLVALGYRGIDELVDFFTHSILRQELITKNYGKYVDIDKVIAELKPRLVTHVLVKAQRKEEEHTGAKAPTKEEQALMNSIDKALKETNNLRLEMIKVSDSKTIIGETLGYVDKNTSFVEPFLSESLKMNHNTLSGWIKTSFGYHRIYVESTNVEDFKETEDFINALQVYDPSLAYKVMSAAMKDAGVKLNATLEAKLLESMED